MSPEYSTKTDPKSLMRKNDGIIKEKEGLEPVAMIRHERQRHFMREQDPVFSESLNYDIQEHRNVRKVRAHITEGLEEEVHCFLLNLISSLTVHNEQSIRT